MFLYNTFWQYEFIKKGHIQHKKNKIQELNKETRHMSQF